MHTGTIRYFVGYQSDLYGMSRNEVKGQTYADRYEAEEAVSEFDDDRPWDELLADLVHEVDLNDYQDE